MRKKTHTKILEIIDEVPDWKIERISRAIDGKELNKIDTKLVVDLIYIQADKDELTQLELEKNLRTIIVLFVLENFRRKGLTKRNKQGIYDKTKIGKEVMKHIKIKHKTQLKKECKR